MAHSSTPETAASESTPRRSAAALSVFLLMSVAAASLGGLFTPGEWYQQLTRPPGTPPGWVFGPAWTILYIAIAVAGWLVWRATHPLRKNTLILYAIQLLLNAAWSPVFFGAEAPLPALLIILSLWIVVLLTLLHMRKIHRTAGWLFIPYLLWISFASYLNAGFWLLN